MVLKSASRGMVPPFMAMEVMRNATELEAAGQKIVHLEVGQPSTGMPKQALARVKSSLEEGPLGYTLGRGLPDLCNRIARHYQDFYGVTVPANRVIVTTGSSAGFILSFLSAFDAGDRVALATPGYPAYRHILKSLAIVQPKANSRRSKVSLCACPQPVPTRTVASRMNRKSSSPGLLVM